MALPLKSCLNKPVALSITISFISLSSTSNFSSSCKIKYWSAELYALALIIFSSILSLSNSKDFEILSILVGSNVPSESIQTHLPSRPPFSFGSCTLTAIV